jgi:hypothetical protein
MSSNQSTIGQIALEGFGLSKTFGKKMTVQKSNLAICRFYKKIFHNFFFKAIQLKLSESCFIL